MPCQLSESRSLLVSLFNAAGRGEDLVEAVIGLAENLFYGTPLAGFIVIFRRKKHYHNFISIRKTNH